MEPHLSMRNQEISLPPSYWSVLSPEDRTEFMRLRSNFLQGQKISSKDRRIVTFRKELITVLKFIERSDVHQEERSVLVGVCFAGPFICVNTRQLKNFLGRCKSSINGSFQQMGYVALRTKAKARSCVVAVMPSLQNEQNILRQWTVRFASNDAHFCFLSSFSHVQLPAITDDDLYDEKRPAAQNISPPQPFQAMPRQLQQFQPMQPYVPQQIRPPPPTKPRQIELDLPNMDEGSPFDPETNHHSDLATSMSVDCFSTINYTNDTWDDTATAFDGPTFDWDLQMPSNNKTMPHSNSAFLPSVRDWDPLDDF